MATDFPLRRVGPRVFISYSFADEDLAGKIGDWLTGRGFQVMREDETSLVGQELSKEIPRRIAECEVLIQILTATSNSSEWVARELGYAAELRRQNRNFWILPVVFDKTSLPEAVKDWSYLDAVSAGLDDALLERIERFCLRTVHVLPLDEQNPLEFADSELHAVLERFEDAPKRVIVDSAGKLQGWAQDTLDHFADSTAQHAQAFLEQERKRMDRLTRRLRVIDVVTAKLMAEVRAHLDGYALPDQRVNSALTPLRNFSRIVIGDLLITAADMAPPAPHPLRTRYKDLISEAREANVAWHSPGFMNPGFYAWALGETGGEAAMVGMGMEAPGFRSIRLVIPRQVFGSMQGIYDRGVAFDPRSELLAGTYIDYVLPQIAVHAAYNLVTPDNAAALEAEYAWKLDQYRNMGAA